MTEQLWATQWRLSHIEVVNWGTFAGHHAFDISRAGHLITGASGSGKSSLLDAIAAVLTPDKWLRFNAAAQESSTGRDDRSLMTYVRGAWSKEADEFEDRTVSSYLRPSATWSGILLRFEDLDNAPVTLVRLLHARGTATDNASLKDACVITRGNQSLPDFAPYARQGIDVSRLKADLSPVVVTSSGKNRPFYARLRSLFGITSENALHLLHKTQAAKNLGTLDTLFRTFMLDEPTTFARATNAVEQFDELNEAHQHVVDLRKQADVLRLAVDAGAAFDDASRDADAAKRLSDLILPYADGIKRDLAAEALLDAQAHVAATKLDAERARIQADEARAYFDSARLATAQVGGTDATHLRARIEESEVRVLETDQARKKWGARLALVGVEIPHGAEDFAELVTTARRELDKPPPAQVGYALHDQHSSARRRAEVLDKEIAELRHRKSNIDGELLRVRTYLAREIGVPEEVLPFAGELLEVRPEHAQWSGAIERVLAPLATALLVHEDMLTAVKRLIDGKHLGVRLRFEGVPQTSEPPPRASDPRSVVHRVNVAEGRFAPYLHRRLGVDFDVACVDSSDELDGVNRGITMAGLAKRSAYRYEKNDLWAVDDRSKWVLGGNNDAKVEILLDQLSQARAMLAEAAARVESASATRDGMLSRRAVLEDLVETEYVRIDGEAARAQLARRQAELEALVRPDSDLDRALIAERDAKEGYDALNSRAAAAAAAQAESLAMQRHLEAVIAELGDRLDDALTPQDRDLLHDRFAAIRRSFRLDTIDHTASQVTVQLAGEGRAADARVRSAESAFVEAATRYRDTWPAQSAELSPSVDDRRSYGDMLNGIVARGLPEHEANFLRLLKERSRDTLIHLRDEIMSAPRRVAERVEPVNASLLRSNFDIGTHLAIQVKISRSTEVQEFLRDLGVVVDGNFEDETLAAAERRFERLSHVMRRLGSSVAADAAWKKRVLDTRSHVTFLARELADDGRVLAVHDSSKGLSGGQRQRLVVFCLAAALRYQLADAEDEVPRYGTIVLDEAFDKADAQYTRMAMDIFREFGFHMVLATPQKLLQTLEPYIGAVTSVSNPTRRSSEMAHVAFGSGTP